MTHLKIEKKGWLGPPAAMNSGKWNFIIQNFVESLINAARIDGQNHAPDLVCMQLYESWGKHYPNIFPPA